MQSFQELSLNPLLMRAVQDLGYEKPSPIQAQALPILLGSKTDFIGLAATGTGKTAAFSLPLLERLDLEGPAAREVQALVLCPTRELAIQVAGQINLLGKHLGVKALPIYGGAGYGDQIYGLKRGANVVVGTPGRVIDHLEKGTLKLGSVHTLVLDEADEMISMGFKEDLETVLAQAPRESSNRWLFSATMSREVRRVADEYLDEPVQVEVNRTEMVPDTIEQLYFKTHEGDKPEILCKLIDAAEDFYGLIFCQTKALVVDLTQYLKARNYLSDCLHGDMDQEARERTMRLFRDRKVKVLVCTDVASRGLDVKDITHVINYSLPRELDNYVHRIGRTARSGKRGVAMSLVTPSHKGLIGRIERMTRSRMLEGKIPTRRELGAKKVAGVLNRFLDQPLHTRAIEVMSEDWRTALAGMNAEEVAGRFLSVMHPEIFADRAPEPKRETRAPAVAPLVAPAVQVARPKAKAATPVVEVVTEAAESSVAAETVAPVLAPAPAPEVVVSVAVDAPSVAEAPSVVAAPEAKTGPSAPMLSLPAELLALEDPLQRPPRKTKKARAERPMPTVTYVEAPKDVKSEAPKREVRPREARTDEKKPYFAKKARFEGSNDPRPRRYGDKPASAGDRKPWSKGKSEWSAKPKGEWSKGKSDGPKPKGDWSKGKSEKPRTWHKAKPYGAPTSGYVGRAPKADSFSSRGDGLGLGRAPQDRFGGGSAPWKSKKGGGSRFPKRPM